MGLVGDGIAVGDGAGVVVGIGVTVGAGVGDNVGRGVAEGKGAAVGVINVAAGSPKLSGIALGVGSTVSMVVGV